MNLVSHLMRKDEWDIFIWIFLLYFDHKKKKNKMIIGLMQIFVHKIIDFVPGLLLQFFMGKKIKKLLKKYYKRWLAYMRCGLFWPFFDNKGIIILSFYCILYLFIWRKKWPCKNLLNRFFRFSSWLIRVLRFVHKLFCFFYLN